MINEEEKNNEQELANFEWDDNNLELFKEPVEKEILNKDEKAALQEENQEVKAETEEEVKKEPKKETEKEVEAKSEKTEEEKTEEEKKSKEETKEFFTKKEEETKEEKTNPDEFYTELAKGLKEKGVLSFVDIPKEDLSEEDFINLQEEEIEKRIEDTFDGFFNELDEDGKAFLKYKKDGGNTKAFFDTLKTTSQYPSGNLEDEDFQKEVLKYYYKTVEDLDDEDISDRLDWAEDNGKLEKYAEKYYSKLETIKKKERAAVIKQAEKDKEIRDKERETFQEELKSKLQKIDNVNNFPITKKEKSELYDYITKPTVKVGKNKYLTGLQKDLQNTTSDFESLILLAKLVRNKFDISDLSKKIQTKQTQSIKSKLQRVKSSSITGGTKSYGKKSLSDFFN